MGEFWSYTPSILAGTWINVACGLTALGVSIIIGMAAALAKLSRQPVLVGAASVYTTIVRGIPDLVLLLLAYYGGQIAVNAIVEALGSDEYYEISPFTAGALAIGFIYGAYMTETFRGAILAVPRGQLEAGYAYGMTAGQVVRRILLPQMIRHALPSFGNNWLVLIKATALLSAIQLEDMVRKARLAAGSTHEPFNFYLFLAIIYLVITAASTWLLELARRRYSVGTQR